MKSSSSGQNVHDVSIVLCGQAGLGVQTVEFLLTRVLKLAGYNVFATKEYMSRIRGGTNSTQIRVSAEPVSAFVDRIDILIPLNKGALQHVEKKISPQTIILAEKENLGKDFDQTECRFFDVPFTKIATEIGNKIYSNIVAVGTIAGLFGVDLPMVTSYARQFFSTKSDEVIKKNIAAAKAGYQLGLDLGDKQKIGVKMNKTPGIEKQILLNGAQAVSLGAIAGGCNFIAAYPMTPSTAVLVFLAQHAKEFGIIAEQAEDEVAAMNMAVGAWYAGARALASTSGGGFALMVEGLSLSAMLETPVVVLLAQRPGPATGLPTRTEQADLELALYAGHGEFPRAIFAPGKIEDAFYLTQKAFNLADKYQVPVFVMTDQYFMDSYYNIPPFDLSNMKVEKHITETKADYKRYKLTENGISPRGIPGYGKGLVCVDSDEHDEDGHITEDLDLRVKMVEKRLKKLELLNQQVDAPEFWPNQDYKNLVICWGSTYHIVKEALANLARDDISLVYYKQVYPLHSDTAGYLKKANKTIIVEGNATSQFGKLIKLNTRIDINEKILKYNGLNFTVEEVTEKLSKLLD